MGIAGRGAVAAECAMHVVGRGNCEGREGTIYLLVSRGAVEVSPATFSDLEMREQDIEEMLRSSVDILCGDEESMLIIGRQVRNEKLGRGDLTAVDNEGNVVLIEIKRDRRDIKGRKEAFEFQAIRYAASYATIKNTDEIVKKVYAPYIEKHRDEFELGDLTSYELGIRKLNEFLEENDAIDRFNRKQRIILVAGDYDDQTLSAVAWMNRNDVDISCFKLTPYRIHDETYIQVERILPPPDYGDYYVDLADRDAPASGRTGITRRSLPRIHTMLEWGVVEAGDVLTAKDRDSEATLLANGNVLIDDAEMSMHEWLKGVFGWSSVQTYVFAIHKESGKSLSEIRREYMDRELTDVPEG